MPHGLLVVRFAMVARIRTNVHQTMGRIAALLATLVSAALMSEHMGAQKAAPAAFVINTEFAALDQSLWGKGEWFSVPAYHALGEQAYDKVVIRRHHNDKTGTWEPGLEMSAAVNDARTVRVVRVKTRLTVLNPKGSHDKDVTVLVEVVQGDTIVQKANLKINVESKEEKSSEATFLLPMNVLTSQPAPGLRLTMRIEND